MTRTDIITRTITVDAPRSVVWEAITVADQLARWFGDIAEVDLRPGGDLLFGWSEFESTSAGVVTVVDEPREFGFTWEAGRDESGEMWSTTVTFTLEDDAGRTRVTVVESGIAALPDDLYDRTLTENSSGWTAEIADLETYLLGARQ